MPKRLLLCLTIGLLHSFTVFASPDNIRVSGTVTDTLTNTPIKGVCVKIKNTSAFICTDSLGHYALKVPSDSLLTFFLPGYTEKEMKITQTRLDLQLSPKPIKTVEEILRYKLEIMDIKLDTIRRNPRDTIRIRGINNTEQPLLPR